MAYLALYRKWRPQLFQEIIGQEHITRTLQNALATNKTSHAYLFCGPRGTGKTTTAKVLAKALNCQRRKSAEPCNCCGSCQEITAGTSMDVIEIDAASHRGIDEIRDLREKVKFSPATGKYRVYIIDEVHMLTNEAFNALLKTLEEPPAHIVFILATTEPHKVPLTILSRCQRFDFHRISVHHLVKHLQRVAEGENLKLEEAALYVIARAAEGGLRDALSILDQVAAFEEKYVTVNDVHQILGTVQRELLEEVSTALSSLDSSRILKLVASLVEEGKDLRLFVRELLAYLRQLLLLLVSPEMEEELAPFEKERLTLQARTFSKDQLLSLLHLLTRVEQEMKWSTQPRVLLEVAIVQATRPGNNISDLANRLTRLEDLVTRLTTGADTSFPRKEQVGAAPPPGLVTPSEELKQAAGANRPKRQRAAISKQPEATKVQKLVADVAKDQRGDRPPDSDPAGAESADVWKQISSGWSEFLKFLKEKSLPVHMYLARGWPLEIKNGCLTVAFAKDDLFKEQLDTAENTKIVTDTLSSFFQQKLSVRFIYSNDQKKSNAQTTKGLSMEETLSLFGVTEEEE